MSSPSLAPCAFRSVLGLLALTTACDCGDSGRSLSSSAPVPLAGTTVAELGLVPFDADQEDLYGPADHNAMYGKRPEIVVAPDGTALDVLVHDHANDATPRAVLFRLEPAGNDYTIARAWQMPYLDETIGFARDDAGAYYVATAVDEGDAVNASNPKNGAVRSGIVYVYKVDANGTMAFTTDLDVARRRADADAEMLINPMVASSGRLAVGGGHVALVHGNNTKPDANGTRHQKAVTTRLDASTGAVTDTSSIWVSHSFDQRYLVDGNDIEELHLGDAYPRAIVLTRLPNGGEYPLFANKGETGNNNTFARLGGIAPITGADPYGYLVLFAAERSTGTDPLDASLSRVAGSRDLALVRVARDFPSMPASANAFLDPALPDAQTVTSGGETVTNHVRYLTSYATDTPNVAHAERPKIVALGSNRFAILWERWDLATTPSVDIRYVGTWATVIDETGAVVVAPQQVTDHHLPRGDDAFALGADAAWVTGDRSQHALYVHVVSGADLSYRRITIE